MAKYDIFIGGKRYSTIKSGGSTFEVAQEPPENADDAVNDAIVSLSFLRIEDDGYGNLEIEFTPITDTEILNAVTNKKSYVRVQLMEHQVSHGGRLNYNPILVNGKRFSRLRSHERSYYGKTWKNLTTQELTNGYCQLQDYQVFPRTNNLKGVDGIKYRRVAVEMFCPAIKRKGLDPFYYEREGYRKISNITEYYEYEEY